MTNLLLILLLVVGCEEEVIVASQDSNNGVNSDNLDCAGVEYGDAIIDECGICNGDNSSCAGCDGITNSNAVIDNCGLCGGDGTICFGCADSTHNFIGMFCDDINVIIDIISQNPHSGGGNDIITSQNWSSGRLTELTLTSKGIDTLPESIGNLEMLHMLYLSGNDLIEIPDVIGTLNNLYKLDLRNNQLENLSENLFQVGCFPNLSNLFLNDNSLSSLPVNIGNLSTFHLWISNNKLTSIPASLCLGAEYIILDGNNLCLEYYNDCIEDWGTQDQSNCCEGENGEPNWQECED